jgi:hypothetical protein
MWSAIKIITDDLLALLLWDNGRFPPGSNQRECDRRTTALMVRYSKSSWTLCNMPSNRDLKKHSLALSLFYSMLQTLFRPYWPGHRTICPSLFGMVTYVRPTTSQDQKRLVGSEIDGCMNDRVLLPDLTIVRLTDQNHWVDSVAHCRLLFPQARCSQILTRSLDCSRSGRGRETMGTR